MMKEKKIAVLTPPCLGHFNPTLGIGKLLIELGYEVCWISLTHYVESSIPEKGRFIKIPEEDKKSTSSDHTPTGMRSLQKLYEEELIPLNRYLYAPVKKIFEEESFHAVITDHQTPIGAILAHEFGIPFVTSVTTPATVETSKHFPAVMHYENAKMVELQKIYGIDLPHPLVCASPLTLIYSSSYFIGDIQFPESFQFVGPSIDRELEEKKSYHLKTEIMREIEWLDDSQPTVLVTLGSILNSEEAFVNEVVKAFEHEPLNILMVADHSVRESWPANFHVHHHIPQLWALSKMKAVICHSGYNTVCESIMMGVPMIVIPVMNDQSYVATKVKLSGAGIRLKFKRLNADQLRNSTFEVLTNEKYARAVGKVKDSFEQAGGKKRASELVDQFISSQSGESISHQGPQVEPLRNCNSYDTLWQST